MRYFARRRREVKLRTDEGRAGRASAPDQIEQALDHLVEGGPPLGIGCQRTVQAPTRHGAVAAGRPSELMSCLIKVPARRSLGSVRSDRKKRSP